MLRRLWLVAAVPVAGCFSHSVEDLRQRAPQWTARYSVPYDTMANCLAAEWASGVNVSVLPQFYSREQRAAITIIIIPAGIPAGDYQIRTNADSTIEVEWRYFSQATHPIYRERADRCGKVSAQ
jgi:hypothetical protein